MDRRNFVRKAGMAVAGSAIPLTAIGCAANQIYPGIPCLAEVAAPVPVAGMTYVRASQIGCALDCDLETGLNPHTGRAATDDAPAINAAMAGATASHPMTLIMDGSALISGLFLPAGGYWSIAGLGCGTGFFIKSGTNNDGIHNGGPQAAVPSDPGLGVPLPARGSSVSLSNFAVNGNRGNGLNGDSTTGAPQGTLGLVYCCINLMSLDNITIENVVVVNSPSYHMRLSNVGNVVVTGCVVSSSGVNTDGVHFDGPANDIQISNCDFTTGDDAIALNCPEGYSGNISRVSVTGCTFHSFSLMRLYTKAGGVPAYSIDHVTVTGCSGTIAASAFLIGTYAANDPNAILELSVSDCQLTAPGVLDISTDFSTISLSGVTWVPANLPFSGYGWARTDFLPSATPYYGGSLTFENCVMQRGGNFPVFGVVVDYGSTIANVAFDGYSAQDVGGASYAPLPELVKFVSGQIGQVAIAALDSTHIAAPVSPGGFASIGSVSGAGVLGTGWMFPDSVMANGSPYVSASTGAPSIKVGGVVQAYP